MRRRGDEDAERAPLPEGYYCHAGRHACHGAGCCALSLEQPATGIPCLLPDAAEPATQICACLVQIKAAVGDNLSLDQVIMLFE